MRRGISGADANYRLPGGNAMRVANLESFVDGLTKKISDAGGCDGVMLQLQN